MYIREGFPGQRLHVLPPPLVREALTRTPTSRLLVTDAGHFPHAARHGRQRRQGAAQAIVILCVDGLGWCEMAGRTQPVRAGEVVVIPPHTPHLYRADDHDPWTIWWMHVTGADIADLLQAIGLPPSDAVSRVGNDYQVLALIRHVVDSMEIDETMSSLISASGSAWHLLALLAAERDDRTAGDDGTISRIQSYLRENLDRQVGVAELARRAGLSPSHFSARFRTRTGYPVTEYVKRLRMAQARQLLITSELTIAEIGAGVGYGDPFYFSRQFRTVHGVSPRDFRRRAKEEVAVHRPDSP